MSGESINISSNPPRNMPSLQEVISIAERLSPQERLRLIVRLWESLPTESWPVLDETEAAAIRRRIIEDNDRWMDPVPWPIVERLLIGSPRSGETKIYAAPRRFDLATIFIVTVAYSLLFSAMSLLQFPPVVSLVIAGFVTLVGIAQAVLFGGAQPRTASLIMGTVIFSIGMLAWWVFGGSRSFPPSVILIFGSFIVIGGAVLGYLSGALIGGVFMLAEYLRRFVRSVVRQRHVEVRDED
jgi:putative addiction module component (TIGR02574 family)